MSISVDTTCLQCYLRRNLDIVRPLGDEEKNMVFAKKILQHFISAPEGLPPPWFDAYPESLLLEMYNLPADRYREDRELSNQFVMERLEYIRAMVRSAPDPVFAGLQFSILGNYLDFAALRGQVSFEKLDDMLRQGLSLELDREVYASLCQDLARGKKLLYITDNAGEIGFDRICAEEIAAKYPHLEITFCVRGGIVANDASREDADAVGIPFPVIDNGNRVAGTMLDQLGAEAKNAMDTADVIISKGMANTETLWGCKYNIYYAFLVKCQKFVNLFEKPLLTPILIQEKCREVR